MSKTREEKIHFFVPLEKAHKGSSHGKDGLIDVQIIGPMSSDKKDLQKDEIDQNILDTAYFEQKGLIKYEHHKEPNPKYNIGVPQLTYRNGNKTEIVGKIFAKPGTVQYEFAKAVVDYCDNMELWNEMNPSNPRNMGFSIEAIAYKDEKGKIVKAFVKDVVVTCHPINDDTLAEVIKKSLEAGHTYNPGDMSGGAAGRVSSLQGDKNKKLIGVLKMARQYKTKEEFKKALMDVGVTEEVATTKAAEWETNNAARTERSTVLNKSLETITEVIGKIDASAVSINPTASITLINKSIEEAFTAMPGTTDVDPVKVFKANLDMNKSLNETIAFGNVEILKGMSLIGGVLKEAFEFNKSLMEENEKLMDKAELITEECNVLKSLIENIDMGAKSQDLNNLPVVDHNAAGAAAGAAGAAAGASAGKVPDAKLVKVAFDKAMSSDTLTTDEKMNLSGYRTGYESTGRDYNMLPDGVKLILKGFGAVTE